MGKASEDQSGVAVAIACELLHRPRGVGDLEEAWRLTRRAVETDPDDRDARFLAALAAIRLGLPEADQLLDDAVARLVLTDRFFTMGRYSLAEARMSRGDFAAYREFDLWHDRMPDRQRVWMPSLAWDGGPLDGRTIFVHCFVGFGDAMMAARFFPVLKARGAGAVIVFCPRSAAHLLSHVEGVDRVITNGAVVPPALIAHDVCVEAISIPARLKTTLEALPRPPYLTASSEGLERWRPHIEAIPGFRVGVAWQGNPGHHMDALRSFRLAELGPLAEVPGVSLVNLQKGPAVAQLADVASPVVDLGPDYHDGDWLETAAVISQLDLVIGPDSAVVHLAGALGKPVWTALSTPAEWRWMRDREDSPWYPTMRLFRQDRLGEWSGVFRRMATELDGLVRLPDRERGDSR